MIDNDAIQRNGRLEDKGYLENAINKAFELLYQKDRHLINNTPGLNEKIDFKHHVGERSIVFRFAYYLQKLIEDDALKQDYQLDCEYNRNGIETKNLPSFSNGTYPDLIIHKRGSNDKNLLIMEFKTYWNTDRATDVGKIKEFMDKKGLYKFKYGISVCIHESKPYIEWISNNEMV